ncbi:MAG: hypothetical protein DHS20C05_13100 [Hyphococcus sp.]|nr:MAG: hypothetical protein DHS20C05_13100 [Marinicaulis sp.]
MSDSDLRVVTAILTVVFIAWIGGYAIYSSRRYKMKAVAVSPRQATLTQQGLIITAVLLDGYLIARAFLPELDRWVMAASSPSPILALMLMVAGFLLVVATHLHMGASWRIGVPKDDNNIDALITTGTHQLSRNPIYLGIMLMLVGMVIAAPGPITVVGLLLTFFGLQSIIAEEEAYLERCFGGEYLDYKTRVRRWV